MHVTQIASVPGLPRFVRVLIMRRRQTFKKTVIKTRTERGRPGTDAITQTQGVVIMQVYKCAWCVSWVHNASLRDVRIDIESIGAWLCITHNYA